MHVCVVCHESSLTGAPRIGFDIALYFGEAFEVTLVSKKAGPLIGFPKYADLKDRYVVTGTSHETCSMSYAERVERACGLLKERAVDLVYVNSVAASDWCEGGRRAGLPVVLHVHETRKSLPSLLSSVATPGVLQYVDLLVGASRAALADIKELTGSAVGMEHDFGIFLDVDAVVAQSGKPAPPAVNVLGDEMGWDRPVVAMCGLAQPRKGADIFLEVARRLEAFDFLWIGPWLPKEAPLNRDCHRHLESLGLGNLYYSGLTDNPYAYLRRIDTFLLTSREDPNPLVVAEALVAKRKVVVFSETGSSRLLVERFGYVLAGRPSVDRAVAMLPRIVGSTSRWFEREYGEILDRVSGERRLSELRKILVDLRSDWGR